MKNKHAVDLWNITSRMGYSQNLRDSIAKHISSIPENMREQVTGEAIPKIEATKTEAEALSVIKTLTAKYKNPPEV